MINWASAGTASAINVEEIIGSLSVNEVMAAMEIGGKEWFGMDLPDSIRDIYLNQAAKGSRHFLLDKS